MAFLGKEFQFVKQDNYDGFVNSLDGGRLNDQSKQAMIAHKPTLKLVKSGNSYTLTTTRPGSTAVENTFTPGVEFDEEAGGNKAKSVVTIDGNTFTQVMKFPEGSITIKREFTDDELVITYTSSAWDGKAVRYFKA